MPKFLNKVNLPRYSSAPSTPSEADLYYNTSDDKIYVYNGAAWVEVGSGAGGEIYYQSGAPSSPSDGDIWIDSDDEVASVTSITNSTSTTSSTVAASATAVKSAYDLAATKAKVSVTPTQPGTPSTGDIWVDTAGTASAINAVPLAALTGTGAMIYGASAGTAATLSIGSTDDQLVVSGGAPAWTANPSITKATLTTTGDIIYASAANTPARLGIGTTSQVLSVVGGIPLWATAAAAGADVQEFTSSGTWTKPAGKTAVYVFGVGGGAGGNGGAKQNSGNAATGGNGGNGGAHNYQWFNASILSATVSVTIGLGGSGGAARTTTGWQTDAGHGGDTTFGNYLKCIGATGSTGAVNQYGYLRLPTVYGRKQYDTGDPYSATPRTVSGKSIPDAGQDLLYSLNSVGINFIQGGVGAYSQTIYGRPSADCLFGAAGGGAGGEKQGNDDANFGGAGGRGFGLTFDTAAAGGTSGGNAGSAAGTQGYGNGGAGGGSGTSSTAGGVGGAGWLGGGGGGGGASQSGNSGAGGAGGGGYVLVISV